MRTSNPEKKNIKPCSYSDSYSRHSFPYNDTVERSRDSRRHD